MTKKEAMRQTDQENTLLSLGFTRDEAEQLRRISMTLRSWHERECGTDSYAIVRGQWNQGKQEFEYDDDGRPYYEFAGSSGRHRYAPIPDRENGAKKRLRAIIDARNERARGGVPVTVKRRAGSLEYDMTILPPKDPNPLSIFIQTDPRGASLYIIRPGDVPEGKDVNGYYTRGICVY